jgi:transglutaminase-like putative cysteine protease
LTRDRCEKRARIISITCWSWAVLSLSGHGLAFADNRYDVVPTPTWVVPAEVPTGVLANGEKQDGGASYLLVDRQTRITNISSDYSRLVTRLENVSGVEDHSQVAINFDPKTERLHLHSVLVRRGAEVIDQLRMGQIRVLQRENDLEQGLIDGELTFHLLLSDVRVGDTIDTSYTRERHSPEWGYLYYERYQTQWDDPVALARVRLSVPNGAPLHIESHGTTTPKQWNQAGWTYTEWSVLQAPRFRSEKHVPGWIEQHASVGFSQFADWAEVAAQGIHLFAVTTPPSTELVALSNRLRSVASGDEDRTVAVMKFVQDEVRYTGIEEGEEAFRPTPPNEVLRRRYGDCKDKTLLAVTLLNSLHIDAAPALVSTRWRGHFNDRLPSPGLFNHAVVRARIQGRTYWFDATSTGQGGRFAFFSQSHLGAGLPLAPGTTSLETMPEDDFVEPRIRSHAQFDFRSGLHSDATLTVSTVYSGKEADATRRRLRAKGAVELGKQYLHYYKGRYSDAVSVAPLEIADNLESNVLTIGESYRISHPFESNKEKGREIFYTEADTITSELDAPDTSERLTGLAVDFPSSLESTVEVLLPTSWQIKQDAVAIDSAAFHYDSKVSYVPNTVTAEYRYRSLTDFVSRDKVEAHLKALQHAKDDTYYSLSFESDDVPRKNRTSAFAGLKFIFVVGSTYLGLRFARFVLARRRRRVANPD